MNEGCHAMAQATGDMNEPAKTCLDERSTPPPGSGVMLLINIEPDELAAPQSFSDNRGLASRRLF